MGMYGDEGGGIAQMLGIQDQVDIIQGTLGKAFGVTGGYIAANDVICDSVRSLDLVLFSQQLSRQHWRMGRWYRFSIYARAGTG